MAIDYDELADLAVELIDEAGGPVTLVDTLAGQGAADSSAWLGTDAAPPSTACVGAVLDMESPPQVLLAARDLATIPARGMRIEAGEKLFRITNVVQLAPNVLTSILYVCEVEQWPATSLA